MVKILDFCQKWPKMAIFWQFLAILGPKYAKSNAQVTLNLKDQVLTDLLDAHILNFRWKKLGKIKLKNSIFSKNLEMAPYIGQYIGVFINYFSLKFNFLSIKHQISTKNEFEELLSSQFFKFSDFCPKISNFWTKIAIDSEKWPFQAKTIKNLPKNGPFLIKRIIFRQKSTIFGSKIKNSRQRRLKLFNFILKLIFDV